MNPSVPHMTWTIICDTLLSDGRERHVFRPDDTVSDVLQGFERSPMARAYAAAKHHKRECELEPYSTGTIEVFCNEYLVSTRHIFYVGE